jgi:hypothetical protein
MHFEVGSTIYFLYYSQVASVIGVKPIDIISQTSAAVAGLVTTLPHEETHPFNFYMDNFLSNVNLFKELRELKIGACGTVRATFKKNSLLGSRSTKNMKVKWDTLSGEVVDASVLAVVWVDNAPVLMLTTATRWMAETWTTSTDLTTAPNRLCSVHGYHFFGF